MMGAGCIVICPNGHSGVEIVTTKCVAGSATVHEMSCGCRNTGPHIQAGVAVTGTTAQVGKPNAAWPTRDRTL